MHARLSRRGALQIAGGAGLALVGLPITRSRAAASALHIAVVLDTTGSASVYGIPSLNGQLLAADEVNAAGGINGRPLDLLVSDGATSLAQVRHLFQQYSTDPRVVAITGPTLSSEAVKMDPIAQAAGLPVLALSNTVPGLTAIGDSIFRISLGDAQIIPAVLTAALARLRFKKVALLYDNLNAATIAEGQIFQAIAARMGLAMVATETYATGARDFSSHLATIKAAQPDALLVAALAQEAMLILKQRQLSGMPDSVRHRREWPEYSGGHQRGRRGSRRAYCRHRLLC